MRADGMHQIGHVASRVGLSLRTVRYYEEVGLVTPSGRTEGGFRLYTDDDVARLDLIKRLKPLDFTLDELAELLSLRDELEGKDLDPDQRARLTDQLTGYVTLAEQRAQALREQVAAVDDVTTRLRAEAKRLAKHDRAGR